MSTDVFPPSNLPGGAVEWGRTVENRVKAGETDHTQLDQKVDNGLRATSGQLAVLAEQITELTERQTQANTLGASAYVYGNTVSDARNYWSPYEFTITKPRGVVLSTAMTASLTTVSGDAGSLVSIVGYEVVPGSISILAGQYGVGTGQITRLTAGTSFGNVGSEAYLRLGPGTYKLWAGVLLTTMVVGSYAELSQGVSTLVVGQPLPEGTPLDLDLP